MEANYVHKDSTTLVQDELVKNELNQIELQYNALKQQKFNELLKENQELKLELSGYRQAILNNEEMLGLKEQNDKLKKKYENAVADYETTMFEKEQLKSQLHEASLTIQEMTERDILCPSNCDKLEKLLKENQELKKQLENKYEKVGTLTSELLYEENTKLINQQKDFIKYLEDEIKTLEKDILETVDDMDIYMKQVKSLIIEEILQKYKSIIGDINDKK